MLLLLLLLIFYFLFWNFFWWCDCWLCRWYCMFNTIYYIFFLIFLCFHYQKGNRALDYYCVLSKASKNPRHLLVFIFCCFCRMFSINYWLTRAKQSASYSLNEWNEMMGTFKLFQYLLTYRRTKITISTQKRYKIFAVVVVAAPKRILYCFYSWLHYILFFFFFLSTFNRNTHKIYYLIAWNVLNWERILFEISNEKKWKKKYTHNDSNWCFQLSINWYSIVSRWSKSNVCFAHSVITE